MSIMGEWAVEGASRGTGPGSVLALPLLCMAVSQVPSSFRQWEAGKEAGGREEGDVGLTLRPRPALFVSRGCISLQCWILPVVLPGSSGPARAALCPSFPLSLISGSLHYGVWLLSSSASCVISFPGATSLYLKSSEHFPFPGWTLTETLAFEKAVGEGCGRICFLSMVTGDPNKRRERDRCWVRGKGRRDGVLGFTRMSVLDGRGPGLEMSVGWGLGLGEGYRSGSLQALPGACSHLIPWSWWRWGYSHCWDTE